MNSITGRTVKTLKAKLRKAKASLAEQESKGGVWKQEIQDLETMISENLGPLPLPPEELRLHVGAHPSALKFLKQGLGSSRKVLSLFGEAPEAPILDLGCGSGRTLRWLLSHPNWMKFYRGTDVDGAAIEWLNSHGIEDVRVCTDKLPFAHAEMGGLFSFSVLTHIHPLQFRQWFEELARVLKPGALAYLTFNGEMIRESKKSHQKEAIEEYDDQGWVWHEREGHYKSAAFANHSTIREASEGQFRVRKIVKSDYHRMDALYAERLS